jgi:hypothetical protein
MGSKKAKSDIELHPDAWERFRGAVHTMTKAGPQHRSSEKPKPKAAKSPAKRKTKS